MRIDNNTFLVTLSSWSMTTATKHLPKMRAAIPNNATIIYMKEVPKYGVLADTNHVANLEYWVKDLYYYYGKFQLAKKGQKTNHIHNIKTTLEYIDTYLNFFASIADNTQLTKSEVRNGLSDLLQKIADIRAKWSTVDTFSILKYEETLYNERQAKKAEKQARINADRVKAWKTFEVASLGYYPEYTLLRFNAGKNRIETSRGIQIPYTVAQHYTTMIADTIGLGGCKNCGIIMSITGSDYTVNEITSDYIIVGCHKVTITEITEVMLIADRHNATK
jgi:hypothetical protein